MELSCETVISFGAGGPTGGGAACLAVVVFGSKSGLCALMSCRPGGPSERWGRRRSNVAGDPVVILAGDVSPVRSSRPPPLRDGQPCWHRGEWAINPHLR